MSRGSKVRKSGVRVIQGTPTAPLQRPTLFLRLWRSVSADGPARTLASLSMARPGQDGYVVKPLLSDMELGPKEALEKAVAIAKRGDVAEVYVNADMSKLPGGRLAEAS
jgi:hypothetical protein